MAITNLQQARQMYQTGQRVAKTLDGSRPGYRGERGYQGSSGGSKASSSTNQGPAGGATIGSGSKQSGSPKARTTSTTPRDTTPTDINDNRLNYRTSTPYVTSVKPQDVARSKLQFIQKLNNDNAIRANQLGTKFVPYQGGSRPKPRSGLAGLLMGGLGMLMGIPGLGLVTGGLRNLGSGIMDINNRIQQSDFGRSKNLMDYLDMKKFGGYDERELARAKRMQEARNLQKMMMLSPSATMTPRDYAMQGLTVPDLGDVSSLVQATDRGLLEAPGDNLLVIPDRNIDYNRIKDYAEGYDLSRDAPPSNPYNYGDDLENEFVTEPYQPSGLETLQPITFEEPTFKPYA